MSELKHYFSSAATEMREAEVEAGTMSQSRPADLPIGQDENTDFDNKVSGSESDRNGSSEADEKLWLPSFKRRGDATQPRPWRATFIRFGPLSGIFCMLLAIASIFASLGILAGSNTQPVLSWTTPPSTYLAIFTAFANLSIRYAAIQGVVIAWWYRALRGSTLAKLHWDWRAGTTIRGAITSGRHMGLLGLACIFSVIVVIDGPLLQRASTVIPAPIRDRTVPLDISLAPQIPHEYSGSWGPWDPPVAGAYNDTFPTINGPVSNHIQSYPAQGLSTHFGVVSPEVTKSWYGNSPIKGAVRGCSGKTCKAKIRAPTLFPTCESHSEAINALEPWDPSAALKTVVAAPEYAKGFSIGTTLVTATDHEWIAMAVQYSVMHNCSDGVLYTTLCSLHSAMGEYDVEVFDNAIQMDDLRLPALIAYSNNTQVNHTAQPQYGNQRPSTLAGLAYLAWQRWYSLLFRYGEQTTTIFGGSVPWTLVVEPDTASETCSSFRNLTDEVLISLNKLAVYMGAEAAMNSSDPELIQKRLDPGVSLYTNATGQVVGEENKFSTHYWFFFAAALVEVVCIALITPTYWGWWKFGRPVSFSPLETAKAFESPMLADCNSNSSGRDIAQAVGDVRVQYGAASADTTEGDQEKQARLAFLDPAVVTTPSNGGCFKE